MFQKMFGKKLLIHLENTNDVALYENHCTFHDGDAGVDLFVKEDVTIPSGETCLVDFGVRCQVRSFSWCPWRWVKGIFHNYHSYLLMPRSSISKTPLLMRNSVGLIDAAYTGTIKAPLYNTSNQPYRILRGQRLVQLVHGNLDPMHVEIVDGLRDTSRGSGGFGSTGQ